MSVNCKNLKEVKEVRIFATKLCSYIWLRLEKDKSSSYRYFENYLKKYDDKTISIYFSNYIGETVLISRRFLRSYLDTVLFKITEQDNFKDCVKFMCSYWVENRTNVFLKVLDTASIIIYICDYCETNKTHMLKANDAIEWFIEWFVENYASDFFSSGSWEKLKNYCYEFHTYWIKIFPDPSNCKIVNRMRNSPIIYPLTEDYFCKKCTLPTDKKCFRNISFVVSIMNSLSQDLSAYFEIFPIQIQYKCEFDSTCTSTVIEDKFKDTNFLSATASHCVQESEKPQSLTSNNNFDNSGSYRHTLNKAYACKKTSFNLLHDSKEQNAEKNISENETLEEHVLSKKNISDKIEIPKNNLLEKLSNETNCPYICKPFDQKEIVTDHQIPNTLLNILDETEHFPAVRKSFRKNIPNQSAPQYRHLITQYFSLTNLFNVEKFNYGMSNFDKNMSKGEEIFFYQTDSDGEIDKKFQQLCRIGTQQEDENCLFYFMDNNCSNSFREFVTGFPKSLLKRNFSSHLRYANLSVNYWFNSNFSFVDIRNCLFRKYSYVLFEEGKVNAVSGLKKEDRILTTKSVEKSIINSKLIKKNTVSKLDQTLVTEKEKIPETKNLISEQADSTTDSDSLISAINNLGNLS